MWLGFSKSPAEPHLRSCSKSTFRAATWADCASHASSHRLAVMALQQVSGSAPNPQPLV